jgi:hypothetical protein
MASTSSRFDPQPPNRDATIAGSSWGGAGRTGALSRGAVTAQARGAAKGADLTYAERANPPLDLAGQPIDMLGLIGEAERISRDYMARTVEQPLARAYRAWQGMHPEGSKYLGTAWRGRSRLFVPKTRAAVYKKLAAAAGAMFATEDVVNITAEFEDDPIQRATAASIKGCLDYRLSRSHPKTGVPWFRIAMGACLDSQVAGVCISKQSWEHMEVEVPGKFELAMVPYQDPETGEYEFDEADNPVMVEGKVPVMRTVVDKPNINLFPIENGIIDPGAPWFDPVQYGRFFAMRYPMGLSDCRAWLKSGADKGFIEVADALLMKGRVDDDRQGVRYAREGRGSDRYEDGKAPGELDIVWVQENFLRISGIDWHWWSVGRYGYLSEVRETREAYPELDGERPYVMGVSQIDSHRVFPQSPVDSWQPLQLELNDITNLRLDTLKRSIAPLPIVKAGKNVDLVALQRRGQPDAILIAHDPSDISFASVPPPPGQGYTESSVTNASFDELAGVFSTSSVQTSRQLNETVGGMRLMAGSANAVGEFDLRTWIETWAEPALRQTAHMVRFHESDPKILAIAGSKARVIDRFGYQPDFSDFDRTDLWLRVNVGIGNADPMQSLAKLRMTLEMLAPMYEGMRAQGIDVDYEAVIEEVFGKAGFRDGRRFFKWDQEAPSQGDGEGQAEMMKVMEELKLKSRQLDLNAEKMQLDFQKAMMQLKAQMAEGAAERSTKLQLENVKGQREIAKTVVSAQVGAQVSRQERLEQAAIDGRTRAEERQHDSRARAEERAHGDRVRAEDRGHTDRTRREDRAIDVLSKREERSHGDKVRKEDQGNARRSEVTKFLFGQGAKQGAKHGAGQRAGERAGQGAATRSGGSGAAAPADSHMARAMLRVAEEMRNANAKQGAALEAIARHLTAPAEIVFGADGKATGVKKGALTQSIKRDGGRITGTESPRAGAEARQPGRLAPPPNREPASPATMGR